MSDDIQTYGHWIEWEITGSTQIATVVVETLEPPGMPSKHMLEVAEWFANVERGRGIPVERIRIVPKRTVTNA